MSSFQVNQNSHLREMLSLQRRTLIEREGEIPANRTNCMARYVQWLKIDDDHTSLRGATSCVAIAAIAALGYFFSTLLALGVGIAFMSWYIVEIHHYSETEGRRECATRVRESIRALEIEEAQSQQESFRAIQETVGGEEAFNQLPILDIGDRVGEDENIDFLTVEDLSAPVMRGTDRFGRPFVAFHMQSDGADGVMTLFQSNQRGGMWMISARGDFGVSPTAPASQQELRLIRQIIETM